MSLPVIRHGSIDVSLDGDDSVRVFYRETIPDQPDTGPPLLLLHGFPSASHQFRRLMDALGSRHRLIAPDYPGFGHTETPVGFTYSFDRLTDVLEGFVTQLGLRRFAMYAFDFGGPLGFRLATRRPERIAGLIVQNANAYDEGLSDMARTTIAAQAEQLDPLFTLPVTKNQYLGGTTRPELIASDGWTLDQHSSTCRTARKPNSPSRWTTTTTSSGTPSGSDGCGSTDRPPSSSGDAATPSSRRPAPRHTFETSLTPGCTCSTPDTSPWRRACRRSLRSSMRSSTTWPTLTRHQLP